MMPDIRMDSHKLIYHPRRVADWLDGKLIYPIEMEVGLSGACNHRCIFCAVDYMEYKPNFLDSEMLLNNLQQMKQKGLKSVIFSGEGEPLLHKDASKIFSYAKTQGLNIALATNGVLLTKDRAEKILPTMTWIRFSIAAATEETYGKIQRGQAGDLAKVLHNLSDAVAIKCNNSLPVTLGAQMLLLPENVKEVVDLGKKLREIGLDYLTVKPFSQHPASKVKRNVDYSETSEIENEVNALASDKFAVYFRRHSIENIEHEKSYDRCYALPFMIHIDSKGDVCPCVAFVGNDKLKYGNLYEHSFTEIWEREKTKQIMNRFSGDFLRINCRKACRLDEMNKYLHELKQPGTHVDFI